ncbi:MAG: PorP/SprF family type IX secretion system membrane protein [Saprospiraceae bacterium]
MKTKFILLFVFVCCQSTTWSQDINFSQFNVMSSYYNPGATGFFDGNFKVRLINRNQWTNFTDKPNRSFALSGDIKFDLGNHLFDKDFLALGVYFLSDKSQALDWNRNEIGTNLAFHKRIDRNKRTYLSGGFGLAVLQRSLSYDNIYFQDQFNGLNDYSGSSSEILPQNIYNTGDLKFGFQFSSNINKKWAIQTGAGLHYLFKPNFSLYKTQEDPNYVGSKTNDAFSRINFITNLTYNYDQHQQFFPRLHYSKQGPQQLIQFGLSYRKSFYNFSQTAFHAGVSLRNAASETFFTPTDLGFLIGFEIKKVIVGLHYDAGISDAARYRNLTNSFEISISLIGDYNNQNFICPEF